MTMYPPVFRPSRPTAADAADAAARQNEWARQQSAQNETMAARPRDPGIVDAEWTEVEDVPLLGPPKDEP